MGLPGQPLEQPRTSSTKVERFGVQQRKGSKLRVQRLQLLEIPNRRWFDVFQPGTLNREPFYSLNLEPGTDQFRFKLLLGHDTGIYFAAGSGVRWDHA
jgi:hypothetical protein